jgi:hypothetical protein
VAPRGRGRSIRYHASSDVRSQVAAAVAARGSATG